MTLYKLRPHTKLFSTQHLLRGYHTIENQPYLETNRTRHTVCDSCLQMFLEN